MATEGPSIDHYAVLEIQFGASDDEVRKAWMRLVRQWQPKANSGDHVANELLQRINAAEEVLSDLEKRAEYDREYESCRQQLDEERRRQEEAERQRRDAEQRKQREDQRRQQEEQARSERERRREDAERQRREFEEQERLRREAERLQQEIERLRREADEKRRHDEQKRSEKEQRRQEEKLERRKEIAIIVAIVMLTIAGVAGVAALTWFVIIPFLVNLATTIWNWIVNTLIPLIVVIGLFAGIMWLMIRASPRER